MQGLCKVSSILVSIPSLSSWTRLAPPSRQRVKVTRTGLSAFCQNFFYKAKFAVHAADHPLIPFRHGCQIWWRLHQVFAWKSILLDEDWREADERCGSKGVNPITLDIDGPNIVSLSKVVPVVRFALLLIWDHSCPHILLFVLLWHICFYDPYIHLF